MQSALIFREVNDRILITSSPIIRLLLESWASQDTKPHKRLTEVHVQNIQTIFAKLIFEPTTTQNLGFLWFQWIQSFLNVHYNCPYRAHSKSLLLWIKVSTLGLVPYPFLSLDPFSGVIIRKHLKKKKKTCIIMVYKLQAKRNLQM